MFPRLFVSRLARLVVGGETAEVQVINISLKGALIATTAPLHVGQRLRLQLLSRGDVEATAEGSIIHRTSRGYGCVFDAMSLAELDCLKTWIAGEAGANERRVNDERVDLMASPKLARITARGEVLTVMEQVFKPVDTVGLGAYVDRVFDGEFLQKSVRLLRNRDKVCVGFNLVWVPRVSLPGGDCAVFRSLAAILPEYRGENSTLGGGFEEALRFRLRFPRMPAYLFLRLLHPSSYRLFSRHAPTMYERFDESVPEEVRALAMACVRADDYPWKQREGGAIVQHIPIAVSDGAPEVKRWQQDSNVERFITHNPDYANGWGLCTVIPMDTGSVVQAYRSYVDRKTRRITRHAFAYRGRGLKKAASIAETFRADAVAAALRRFGG